MKWILISLLSIICITLVADDTRNAPFITLINPVQRTDGSKIVDIYYNFNDAGNHPSSVWFNVSSDNGVIYDIYPKQANCSGDYGINVMPGNNKHIIWNAGNESFKLDGSYVYQVFADDSNIPMSEDFVYIAGGTFNNGTSNVTISRFYMDRFELTDSDYRALMGENDWNFLPNWPASYLSWFDCIEYCNKRSINEGFTPCYSYSTYGTNPADWPAGWNTSNDNHLNVFCNWTVSGYRLPTEAEWEYAARGGAYTHNYIYSGSDGCWDVAWYVDNSNGLPHDVGTKAPNELGIYDLSGNGIEWCWDIYGDYPAGAQTNPRGPATGRYHIARGGYRQSNEMGCSVSYRLWTQDPTYNDTTRGIRLVRWLP
jgi:formylglycine-generating enzyme